MLITTLMFYVMSREVWRWSIPRAALVAGLFLFVDIPFFGANALKIRYGGLVPLVIALGVYTLITTWQRGRQILARRMLGRRGRRRMPSPSLAPEPRIRVPPPAHFMSG